MGLSARRRVLLVEDDVVVARAIAKVLESHGLVVVRARTHAEATAAGGGFDGGVFDIDLGGENGIDLARRLLDTGAVQVAVFHSGETSVDVRLTAADVGSFSDKRDGIHALYAMLVDALDERVAEAAGAEGSEPTRRRARSRTGRRRKLR